jgi:hypothetical protein
MQRGIRPHEEQAAGSAGAVARSRLRAALAWAIGLAALAGLVAGGLLLRHAAAPDAGADLRGPAPAIVAAGKPSEGDAPQRISPYVKVARERATTSRPEHQPNLRLSVRGAQKASGR